jgi:MFS family permease
MSAPIQLPNAAAETAPTRPWYAEVTRYQWLVLAIASAGWVFDAFEGQLFNLTRADMIPDLLGHDDKRWGELCLAIFLVGGAVGGIAFGSLADRIGRKPTMVLTILFYSIFSGLTYSSTELWQIAALRFLIALGVGGEWAVGAALVAEVFPTRARARASSIFHATSILGTWLAAIAGMIVATHWRYAYLVGVAPAVLVFLVTAKIREPESWQRAEQNHKELGSLRALFGTPRWSRRAIFGTLLAAVGLGTFWSVTVAGQDLTKELLVRTSSSADMPKAARQRILELFAKKYEVKDIAAQLGVSQNTVQVILDEEQVAAHRAKFAYGIVETTGGGLGLLAFGPLADRWGRKRAFAALHLGALAVVPMTCYLPQTYTQMLIILPFFGFFTLGIHAGYAVYFPELFPNHLRATGAGVCFNGGRLLAAPLLWLSSELKDRQDVDLRMAVSLLGLLFFVGLFLLLFLPETKGRPLPE